MKQTAILSIAVLLILSACSAEPDTEPEPAPSAVPAASSSSDNPEQDFEDFMDEMDSNFDPYADAELDADGTIQTSSASSI